MNLIEKASIIAYHRSRLSGSPSYMQGWRSKENQLGRFQTLAEFGNFSGCSVLDLGCGLGDFKQFLDERFVSVEYLGVDMFSEFVKKARERFFHSPDTSFVQADFLSGALPLSDIIVASGSLNYRTENPNHPFDCIRKMWESCRIGIAFNLLDKSVFQSGPLLCGYDPDDVLMFCRTLDCNAEIIRPSHPEDMAFFLRKASG